MSRGQQDNAENILYGVHGRLVQALADADAVADQDHSACQQCGGDEGTADLHACAYDEDIANDQTPRCNCCQECEDRCADDV